MITLAAITAIVLAGYVALAPDWFTLGLRGGVVGAWRGFNDVRTGKVTPKKKRKPTGTRKAKAEAVDEADDEPAASDPSGTDTSSGPALWRGTLSGWREGVRAARARREEGKDLWSRSTRVAGFMWAGGESIVIGARRAPADFTSWWNDRLARWRGQEGADETTDPVDEPNPHPAPPTGPPPGPTGPPPGPRPKARPNGGEENYDGWDIVDAEIVEDSPNQQTPNTAQPNYPAIAGKDTNMAINLTELNSPNAVASETSDAMQVAAAAKEVLAAQRKWSTGLLERLHSVDWGTDEMRLAAAGLAEQGGLLVFPESYVAALDRLKTAVEKAQGFGEVVAEHGAHGNADAFKAA